MVVIITKFCIFAALVFSPVVSAPTGKSSQYFYEIDFRNDVSSDGVPPNSGPSYLRPNVEMTCQRWQSTTNPEHRSQQTRGRQLHDRELEISMVEEWPPRDFSNLETRGPDETPKGPPSQPSRNVHSPAPNAPAPKPGTVDLSNTNIPEALEELALFYKEGEGEITPHDGLKGRPPIARYHFGKEVFKPSGRTGPYDFVHSTAKGTLHLWASKREMKRSDVRMS